MPESYMAAVDFIQRPHGIAIKVCDDWYYVAANLGGRIILTQRPHQAVRFASVSGARAYQNLAGATRKHHRVVLFKIPYVDAKAPIWKRNSVETQKIGT